jgi:hypothetical protein
MSNFQSELPKAEEKISAGAKILAALLSLFGVKVKKGPKVEKIT